MPSLRRPHGPLAGLALAGLLLAGCAGRQERSAPPSYEEIERTRLDLHPIDGRSRQAMGEDLADGPAGPVSMAISLDKQRYRKDDPVLVTMLWLNNTDEPIRIPRKLYFGANFDALIFLDDRVRVVTNLDPEPPHRPLRTADFVVLPPYGEYTEVINLKDLPRFGPARGQRVVWGYNLTRPGKYKVRISTRSVPYQLLPEQLRGDPTARFWEGAALSNVAEFVVRRR